MLTKRLEILFYPKEFDILKKKAMEEGWILLRIYIV